MKARVLVSGLVLLGLACAGPSLAGYKPDLGLDDGVDRAYGAPVRPRRHGRAPYRADGVYRFVYAESFQGFRRAAAPVRKASLGDQVRLPGGTWVYCEFSCEYTLRRQSVDIWEGVTGQGSVSPGIFRKEIYLDDIGSRWRH